MVKVTELDTSLTFKEARNLIKGHHVAAVFNLGPGVAKNEFERHRQKLWKRLKTEGVIRDNQGGKL